MSQVEQKQQCYSTLTLPPHSTLTLSPSHSSSPCSTSNTSIKDINPVPSATSSTLSLLHQESSPHPLRHLIDTKTDPCIDKHQSKRRGSETFFKHFKQLVSSRHASPASSSTHLTPQPSSTHLTPASTHLSPSSSQASHHNSPPHKTPCNHLTPATGTSLTLKEKYGKPCQLLGKGSQGSCWLVKRASDDKLFAVKEFKGRQHGESEKQWTKKLTTEYCIGSLLHHPNVIETLDIIFEKGHAYEVMELCQGGDLHDLIMEHKMTQKEKDCVFRQLIKGVNYLHQNGICHRDLKPENCLFDSENHLKIIDFGCAQVVKTAFESKSRLCTGLCGSDPYMAPEEFTQSCYDGTRVDIWSCGIIYLNMVYGRYPWLKAQEKDAAFMKYVHTLDMPMLHDLPPQPRALIVHMLQPNPELRCTTQDILENAWFSSIETCDSCTVEHHHSSHE